MGKDIAIVTNTFIFNIIIIIIFAIIYAYIGSNNFKRVNKQKLTYLDYLFYSVTIQTGVGLPDITAISNIAKILALIQQLILMASAYIIIVLFIRGK